MKRFWKDVGIAKRDDKLAVTLDNRPLKTPSGNILQLPKNKTLLATLIAAEWDHQETLIKPHALPMVLSLAFFLVFELTRTQTSLASRAIDALGEGSTREEIRLALLNYLDTDTIW